MIHTVLAKRSCVSVPARGRTFEAVFVMTGTVSIGGASVGTTNGCRLTNLINFQPICYYLEKGVNGDFFDTYKMIREILAVIIANSDQQDDLKFYCNQEAPLVRCARHLNNFNYSCIWRKLLLVVVKLWNWYLYRHLCGYHVLKGCFTHAGRLH